MEESLSPSSRKKKITTKILPPLNQIGKKEKQPLSSHRRKRIKTNDNNLFLILSLITFCIVCFQIIIHSHFNFFTHLQLKSTHEFMKKFDTAAGFLNLVKEEDYEKAEELQIESTEELLKCPASSGIEQESINEMIYWHDIPSDYEIKSSLLDEQEKYLTFEPDHGGWNNIRMAFETMLVLAISMGRILVLPPEARMYLLHKDRSNKNEFGFLDFMDLDFEKYHDSIKVISMTEFLQRHYASLEEYPALTKTEWDGQDLQPLWDHFRTHAYTDLSWNPSTCIAVIPSTVDDENHLQQLNTSLSAIIKGQKNHEDYDNNPTSVSDTIQERIKEQIAERTHACLYTKEMHDSSIVHFQVQAKKSRFLTHFYSFVVLEDYHLDLWIKRLVRDHVKYKQEFFCHAAKIVQHIRNKAKTLTFNNPKGKYNAFHIRRGDFQYQKIKLSAEQLYEESKDSLEPNSTIYIATDERDKSFFDPLRQHYNLLFLDDFLHLLPKNFNKNFYGMMDQLLCTRSEVFYGSYRSTFTGFITRMRGYYSTKEQWDGYRHGTLENTWYFTPKEYKEEMRIYRSVRAPFYMREFPIAWRDIDFGLYDEIDVHSEHEE